MRKNAVLISILIISLSYLCHYSKAEYNVSTGAEFQYDVNTWNWEATYGSNYASAQGFRIDNHLFDEGEDFTVKVLDTPDNYSADWRFEKDGYYEEFHTSDFGTYLNILLMVSGPTIWFVPNLPINETRIQEGLELSWRFYPFHDVDDFYWEFFENRANITSISSHLTVTYRNYTDIQVSYKEKNGLVLYEQYYNYGITQTIGNYSIDFISSSNLFFSIDKTTGVLQGFRHDCREYGLLNGTNFDLKSKGHIEIKGYNMPKFNLGEYAGLPGFTMYVLPFTLIAIILTRFYLKKRRAKY